MEMLGESLSYKACMHDELVLSETTTWKSNSESEADVEAWALIATFLWNSAPWLEAMPESNFGSGESVYFAMPAGADMQDVRTRFVAEQGAIIVKALEAWWARLDSQ